MDLVAVPSRHTSGLMIGPGYHPALGLRRPPAPAATHEPTTDPSGSTESRLPEPVESEREARRADDAALLARIVDRDERAVEALYERYSRPLYSLAYQVTGADRFAQDVVQEVFVAVWKDASRFDPTRGALAPWLFSLARHKAIDLVRREANVRKHTADVDLEFREAPDDVDREAWLNLRRDRVREAIGELTETPARGPRARVLLRADPRGGRRTTRDPARARPRRASDPRCCACARSWAPACPRTSGTTRWAGLLVIDHDAYRELAAGAVLEDLDPGERERLDGAPRRPAPPVPPWPSSSTTSCGTWPSSPRRWRPRPTLQGAVLDAVRASTARGAGPDPCRARMARPMSTPQTGRLDDAGRRSRRWPLRPSSASSRSGLGVRVTQLTQQNAAAVGGRRRRPGPGRRARRSDGRAGLAGSSDREPRRRSARPRRHRGRRLRTRHDPVLCDGRRPARHARRPRLSAVVRGHERRPCAGHVPPRRDDGVRGAVRGGSRDERRRHDHARAGRWRAAGEPGPQVVFGTL